MTAWLFTLSVLLLLAAHGARAARWAFLFPQRYSGASRFALFLGLGIGYAVNAIVPFRLGELVRGAVVTRLRKMRFAETMATIVAERVADLAVIAIALVALAGGGSDATAALWSAGLFTLAAIWILGAAIAVRHSPIARGLIWKAAGLFNDRVRLAVADFAWSASEVLLCGALLRWRFLLATIGMWALYGAAYFAFARAIGAPLFEVVSAILRQPLGSLAISAAGGGGLAGQLSLYAFVLPPVLLILLFGAVKHRGAIGRASDRLLGFGRSCTGAPLARSDRFRAPDGYESFLKAMFSGEDEAVRGFGLEAVDDCIVHKFFQGGSDALTALVETEDRMIIRKFAVGAAADRLKVQARWLQQHGSPALPLVQVAGDRNGRSLYSYDMPLVTPANDFYDVIHSSPGARNRERMIQVLDRMEALHRETAAGEADVETIRLYLDEKVRRNAETIAAFARGALGGERYRINDVDAGLRDWDCLSDPDWLDRQIRHREVATIHGDLTIENVIIAPEHPHGLYIIDPNPENIFDSPLIDWAKMMQSLHLGYETLNRGISCALSGNTIRLATPRSQAYAELHEALEKEIRARMDEDRLREIYFHELVNYLRLTTYKIRQSPARGLGFFACTSLLLRRYRERFG